MQKHATISSSISGAHSAFFSSHAIRWILFLMCTKKTVSKQVSEDKEQQVKAKKQLFQVLINLYLWKLTDSGLYQRIRQHYNSSQSVYSARLKVNNWIKPLFLGGSHKENDAMCVNFVSGLVRIERLLECTHKEAYNRIFPMQTTQ